jgi:hypothetical protein
MAEQLNKPTAKLDDYSAYVRVLSDKFKLPEDKLFQICKKIQQKVQLYTDINKETKNEAGFSKVNTSTLLSNASNKDPDGTKTNESKKIARNQLKDLRTKQFESEKSNVLQEIFRDIDRNIFLIKNEQKNESIAASIGAAPTPVVSSNLTLPTQNV